MSRRIAVFVVCALALPVSTAQAWTWPVDGPVVRVFSFDHAHPYAAGQHRGVDLGAAAGTGVRAPFSGVASFAGTVPGGGRTVSIRTELGLTLTLVHLGSIAVARGAEVAEGDVVGMMGPSGTVDSTEPFVYFGVRRTADEQGYLDPLQFLPPRPAVVARPEPVSERPAAAMPAAPAEAAPAPAATAPPMAAPASTPAVEPAATVLVDERPAEATAARPAPVTAPAAGGAQAPVTSARARIVAARPMGTAVSPTPAQRHETHVRRPSTSRSVKASVRGEDAVVESSIRATRAGVGAAIARRGAVPGVPTAPADGRRHVRTASVAGIVVVAALSLLFAVALAGAAVRRRARIMSSVEPKPSRVKSAAVAQDPRRPSLAVCVGKTAPGPRRRVRSAGGHLRALPPLEGERRPDGERNRRARDARDGHGGSRRRLAA
jgi:hypothetical protein